MKTCSAHQYQSKGADRVWANSGRGEAKWDPTALGVPPRGPNKGIVVIDRVTLHGTLNLTVATATLQGEDKYRAFRTINLKQVDQVKRIDGITGDAARLISYAHNGPELTHEHPDLAASTADVYVTCCIPLAKPYSFEYDDFSLPQEHFLELAVGLAQGADMSLGTSVVTVNSGTYWVVCDWHEEMSIVQHAVDTWKQQDFDTSATGTFQTGGRLQDMFLFVRGANGGASLANLTDAFIPQIMDTALLREPDLKQAYARARFAATNLSSTKGNPLRTDPFIAADGGTHRALALMIATGSKCFDGRESKAELIKTTLAGALSLTMVGRTTLRKSDDIRNIVTRTHDVNTSYIKSADKTRRNIGDWPEELRSYLPEKFQKVDRTGKRVR